VRQRDLAVVQGWADTRATLVAWNRAPFAVLWRWLLVSGAITAVLLVAVLVVASGATPDPWPRSLPGITQAPRMGDVLGVFARNLLVLALHAFACLAGYIAKSSLPREAEGYGGTWRRVHDLAGPTAIAFVAGATLFSLCTQAYVLGSGLASLAPQLGTSPAPLLAGLLVHAVPELVALFLPLAAWMIASRRGDWHELLAATVVTVVVAVPLLIAAAFVEVRVSPGVLRALAG
jgi:hypothetical protein